MTVLSGLGPLSWHSRSPEPPAGGEKDVPVASGIDRWIPALSTTAALIVAAGTIKLSGGFVVGGGGLMRRVRRALKGDEWLETIARQLRRHGHLRREDDRVLLARMLDSCGSNPGYSGDFRRKILATGPDGARPLWPIAGHILEAAAREGRCGPFANALARDVLQLTHDELAALAISGREPELLRLLPSLLKQQRQAIRTLFADDSLNPASELAQLIRGSLSRSYEAIRIATSLPTTGSVALTGEAALYVGETGRMLSKTFIRKARPLRQAARQLDDTAVKRLTSWILTRRSRQALHSLIQLSPYSAQARRQLIDLFDTVGRRLPSLSIRSVDLLREASIREEAVLEPLYCYLHHHPRLIRQFLDRAAVDPWSLGVLVQWASREGGEGIRRHVTPRLATALRWRIGNLLLWVETRCQGMSPRPTIAPEKGHRVVALVIPRAAGGRFTVIDADDILPLQRQKVPEGHNPLVALQARCRRKMEELLRETSRWASEEQCRGESRIVRERMESLLESSHFLYALAEYLEKWMRGGGRGVKMTREYAGLLKTASQSANSVDAILAAILRYRSELFQIAAA